MNRAREAARHHTHLVYNCSCNALIDLRMHLVVTGENRFPQTSVSPRTLILKPM